MRFYISSVIDKKFGHGEPKIFSVSNTLASHTLFHLIFTIPLFSRYYFLCFREGKQKHRKLVESYLASK